MASLAARARPPILTIVALFALTLVAGAGPQASETRPERALPWPGATAHAASDASQDTPGDVVSSPAFADARPWNHGGMVIAPPPSADRITRNALTDLLSGLFDVVRSLRV
jgi:hypothetical protein